MSQLNSLDPFELGVIADSLYANQKYRSISSSCMYHNFLSVYQELFPLCLSFLKLLHLFQEFLPSYSRYQDLLQFSSFCLSIRMLPLLSVYQDLLLLLYPPQTKLRGYIVILMSDCLFVRLFVRSFVRLSVRPSLPISNPLLL